MSDAPPRIVSFAAQMKPSGYLQVGVAGPNDPNGDIKHGAAGGMIMLKILSMSPEERRAQVASQAEDPLVVFFSMLTFEERRELFKAAELQCRERITDG
jgi:hypothetical protein